MTTAFSCRHRDINCIKAAWSVRTTVQASNAVERATVHAWQNVGHATVHACHKMERATPQINFSFVRENPQTNPPVEPKGKLSQVIHKRYTVEVRY